MIILREIAGHSTYNGGRNLHGTSLLLRAHVSEFVKGGVGTGGMTQVVHLMDAATDVMELYLHYEKRMRELHTYIPQGES